MHRTRLLRPFTVSLAALVAVVALGVAIRPVTPPRASDPIRIGGVFPLAGNAAGLAGQELEGVRIAIELANAGGGIGGRPLELDVRDLESAADAPAAMAALKADGVAVVVGAYSSDLSIAASAAANDAGLVYWEAGAVADRLTGRGLPLVFRVGTSGSQLGRDSADFVTTQLAPRLGEPVAALRIAVVNADDDYARSVADAAETTARTAGATSVGRFSYDLNLPQWPQLMAKLQAAAPDVLILASHIPDGVAFRRAMLSAGLHVKALIGSTMAECDPDFAGDLGPDAVGIFASDRPTGGFQPSALDSTARSLYGRFAAAWAAWAARPTGSAATATPAAGDGWGDASESTPAAVAATPEGGKATPEGATAEPEYALTGPDLGPAAGPTEEGLSGFAAAWPLVHDVLPAAARSGALAPDSIAAAARAVDLPTGALPNGAGLRFSSDPATLGQNERAAAVIWQWQAVRTYAFVWPPTYATGPIEFVPLAR